MTSWFPDLKLWVKKILVVIITLMIFNLHICIGTMYLHLLFKANLLERTLVEYKNYFDQLSITVYNHL